MRALLFLACAIVVAGCGAPEPVPRQQLPAAADSRRTELDHNQNGKTDAYAYWEGHRLVRTEIDSDENGRIERWEHYEQGTRIARVGTSSKGDGVEDTWSYPDAAGLLIREEFDEDRDGVVDRRHLYASRPGAAAARVLSIVELGLDAAGVPKRRLFYRQDGSLERSETLR